MFQNNVTCFRVNSEGSGNYGSSTFAAAGFDVNSEWLSSIADCGANYLMNRTAAKQRSSLDIQ